MQVSLFLKHGRSCSLELLIGLTGWKFSFLGEEEETELTGVTFLPRKRFEQLAFDVFDEIPLPNSPLNLLLGEGDFRVLLGRDEYPGLSTSGSFLKLF
ncbi:hypothetical protein SLEP1_g11454 [Rubroshorea leprosula]|uniref:Uncharacterized protein n=1 Tax=Rubroshorea leprosula TaxID=152421 RepID=A0AAV5IJV4_9ROSI|nr:hypothetical protein SLEP1_g11454 [Rubroshorea leprosula]